MAASRPTTIGLDAWTLPRQQEVSNTTVRLLVLALLLSPLSMYRIGLGPINVSIDRVLLLICVLSFLRDWIRGMRLRADPLMLCCILALFFSAALSLVHRPVSYDALIIVLPPLLLNLTVFWLVANLGGRSPQILSRLLRAFAAVGLFFVGFAIYTLGVYFVSGELVRDIPFRSLIPLELASAGHIEKASVTPLGGFSVPRLTLPYSSAPILSVAAGLLSLVCFGAGLAKERRSRFWLALALLLALVAAGTFSRSGFYAMIVGYICFFTVLGFRSGRLRFLRALWLPSLVAVFILAGVMFYYRISPLQPLEWIWSSRLFASGSVSFAAHLRVRLLAIEILSTSDPLTVMFGYGLGQFREVTGISSAHMTYVTTLFERGVIGFPLTLSLFLYVGLGIVRRLSAPIRGSFIYLCVAAFSTWVAILTAFLFYESFYLTILWAVLGLISAVARVPISSQGPRAYRLIRVSTD